MFGRVTAVTLLVVGFAVGYENCIVSDFQSVDYSLRDLAGTWFKVSHKVQDATKTAGTVKLEADGEKLKITAYNVQNGECVGPLIGEYTKNDGSLEDGSLQFITTKPDGSIYVGKRLVVHYEKYTRAENQEKTEMLVLYVCKWIEPNGRCRSINQRAVILSRSRHPSAYALNRAVRSVAKVCIDPKELTTMNTMTECGNEILPEALKYTKESKSSSSVTD